MCSYQTAQYDITVSDLQTGVQVARSSMTHIYGDGKSITVPVYLKSSSTLKSYYTVLNVNSLGLTGLQSVTTLSKSLI